jgi:hypothetical protein
VLRLGGKNPREERWRWLSRPRGRPGRAGPRKGGGAGERTTRSVPDQARGSDPGEGMTPGTHLWRYTGEGGGAGRLVHLGYEAQGRVAD